jgi:HEPN domain
MGPASNWLTDALATRDLERVQPSMPAAGERINDARRHIRSARQLADDDTTLAISACHDAIRKALTAHMAATGLRARSGDGAHRIVLDYARNQLADVLSNEDIIEADELRRDRVLAEYGDFAAQKLTGDQARSAAVLAERIGVVPIEGGVLLSAGEDFACPSTGEKCCPPVRSSRFALTKRQLLEVIGTGALRQGSSHRRFADR